MNDGSNEVKVEAAAISDRGLSEKRPLNEDSFLSDHKRRIFAVADGVGGAQAGEVASRTAMEVLDEAFRHQVDGSDIEDLMEIAIQRANASIHRMAQEHPKLSTMATTVVALHLDGRTATIGHVGDSRLYRLAPDGELHRETRDHSVVEEEVRAGRMTPAQAANHPSRNVISRALGAEEGVEVDMNTLEVEDGTAFLLCSDGITRHIPDDEIKELLSSSMSLDQVCQEMKRRCYERGAEDNLTAVLVRIGMPAGVAADNGELDRTVDALDPHLARTMPGHGQQQQQQAADKDDTVETEPVVTVTSARGDSNLQPASRVAFPGADREVLAPEAVSEQVVEVAEAKPMAAQGSRPASASGRLFRSLLLFLIGAIAGAAALYYGNDYVRRRQAELSAAATSPTPSATPSLSDDALSFDLKRRDIDRAPGEWLANGMKAELAAQNIQRPEDSSNPEFLYLYGRALLLTGNHPAAIGAFEQTISRLEERYPGQRIPLKVDARLARAAAVLMTPDKTKVMQPAINSLNEMMERPAPVVNGTGVNPQQPQQ